MLQTPLSEQSCVIEYIQAQRNIFELTLIDNVEVHIAYAYEVDYHNFMALATKMAKAFKNLGDESVVRGDTGVFMELLRENIFTPAIRRMHTQMIDEGINGQLSELFVSCEHHNITLHDWLSAAKKSIRSFERKIVFHGGKEVMAIFNDYLDRLAKDNMITVENDITPETWTCYFYYENSKNKFFQANSSEYLFHSILAPVMNEFYNEFRN